MASVKYGYIALAMTVKERGNYTIDGYRSKAGLYAQPLRSTHPTMLVKRTVAPAAQSWPLVLPYLQMVPSQCWVHHSWLSASG
jgi:hypothetical protein